MKFAVAIDTVSQYHYIVMGNRSSSIIGICPLGVSLLSFVAIPLHAQEVDAPSVSPTSTSATVIDDETSELDATVVTSTPAPVRAPEPTQTVRRATTARPVEIEVYDTIEPEIISGGAENTVELTGSGFFVTAGDIRDQNYVNINRVLAKVPGVYVREEDGAGLFPNISIRGVDGTRSEKITIMEDGILQAPAPYSAPAAYYSPNVGRMAGVEVLKGSSQIAFGPQTTGGVINYLSTPIPDQEQLYLRTTYGSNATALIHSHYGNKIETQAGTLGYLAEIFYKRSDGFRNVEGAPAFEIPSSNDTGYKVVEPMIKLSWEPDTLIKQKTEFKYGSSDVDANESYLGLTEADLAADPYRRYVGSFLDNIQTQQHRTYLKHSIAATDDLDLQFAAYYNQFERDWFKVRRVNGVALHTTVGPTGLPANLATLQGRAPGVLGYRHNARTYESYGGQSNANYRFELGETDHNLAFGVREHRDKIRRFQENTNVTLAAGANPVITNLGPGSGGNRLQKADSTAIWLQDSIETGALTVTPGIRHESVRIRYADFQNNAANIPTAAQNGDVDWTVLAIGFNYDFNETHSIFGGVHQGIAVPSPRNVLRAGVEPEESLAYEFGFRHQSDNLNAELVGFLTGFENIISTSAGLGLGNGATANAGTASVHGFEALVSYDPFQDNAVRMPTFVSVTYTDAVLNEALQTGGGENIYGDGAGGAGLAGAMLPYIPKWKITTGVGLESENWGIDLTASYISDTIGTALNATSPQNSSRQGLVDGGTIVDLSGYYQINNKARFIAGVHNLFEEVMVTSRIPEGPRVNAPREFYVGFELLLEEM